MITIKNRNLNILSSEKNLGVYGDNLHKRVDFLITDAVSENAVFRLYLTFDDGSVNFLVLSEKGKDDKGIHLVWNVEVEHIYKSGVVTAQIKAFENDEVIWHTTSDTFVVGSSPEESSCLRHKNAEFLQHEKALNELYALVKREKTLVFRLIESADELQTFSETYKGYLVNINENCVFACSTNQWKDAPENSVFINRRYSTHYNIQTVTVLSTGVEYTRIVDRRGETITDENANDKYESKLYKEQDWKSTNDNCFQYRSTYTVQSGADSVNNKLSNILDVGCFAISVDHYNDMPKDYVGTHSATVVNLQTTGNYGLQYLFANESGITWFRIVNRTEKVVTQDWKQISDLRLIENKDELSAFSETYKGYLVNINENCVFACSTNQWKDVPANSVFINRRYSTHYNIQTVTVLSTGVEYTRIVDRRGETITDENANDKYESKLYNKKDWKSTNDNCFQYRSTYTVQSGADSVNNKLSNILDVGCFAINVGHYNDMPKDYVGTHSATVVNLQTTGNYGLQYLFANESGITWFRIVNRTEKVVMQDWKRIGTGAGASDTNPQLKILALGDSICRGARNDEKGFVGDLGMPYKNIGVSGATLSNVRTDVTNIPDQLVNETEYQPDIIIANGGVNDYYKNAKMGILSDVPVSTNAEAEALDRSTLLGGLEYLFYTMISRHPKAQRFFLITHKTYAPTLTQTYWTTTPNQAGYTQQEMHDAIVECCNAYNVKVIDVYNDSMMNTLFSEYRSTESWSGNTAENKIEITNNNYCDFDGVHPLAYGYKECYVPLVKQAIGIGTVK